MKKLFMRFQDFVRTMAKQAREELRQNSSRSEVPLKEFIFLPKR